MKELADHLEFFAELGVTHLRIPAPGASATKSSSRGDLVAPWEDQAADPAFLDALPPQQEEGQADLFEAADKPTGPAASPPRTSSAQASSAQEKAPSLSEDSMSMFTSVPELPAEPIEMEEVRRILGDCTRCPLSQTRTQLVFGVGDPSADLLFVGEAPGSEEDELGLPFVGAAGKLLSKIIRAIDLYRDQVYVANILKCRPPDNRDPLPEEVEQCGPFLYKQIQAVEPLVIVALGRYAAQTLLQTETPISSLRGRFHDFHGIPLMPTFHPSYLLRNPSGKRPVWEDMQAVRSKLKESGSLYYAERS
ncbi:MAG TPA: uracil-DNA glycosylase [Acidobacteriota bacterium]|nr:uracil-DNA glycosylase [Acidobacteriota bacterium]